MIALIVVTHGALGQELLKVAEIIKGEFKYCSSLSIDHTQAVHEITRELVAEIKKQDRGQGVLIFTDLFGGTPSNIALSYLKEGKVEVISGVNLPMILKFLELRDKHHLRDLAPLVAEYGRKNIYLASEILTRKVKA
jgi:PTS system mannose-specific IIA component